MPIDVLSLPAGSLQQTVIISAPSPTGDVFGAAGNTWVPVLTSRASLQQIIAKTMFQTGALSTSVSHKLRMRYRSGVVIEPGFRVTYSSRVYRIVNVDNLMERNRVWEILLLETGGKG